MKKTYLNRETVETFLRGMVKSEKLAGEDPCAFWARAHFLKIQTSGHSQKEMLEIVDKILQEVCKFSVDKCGKPGGDYVYVDDVMFSGNRVGNDLAAWIADKAPAKSKVHIVVAAIRTSGEYLVGKRLTKAIADSGKDCIEVLADRNHRESQVLQNDSEVLRPVEVPADRTTQNYIVFTTQVSFFELRQPGGKRGPFSRRKDASC
ncbi:MAG: hypothetical protein IPO58_06035 [Betaproteobacteria bacterium]|nr:hypothetical protein [Betaproteobacteria bacterium]